MAAVLLDTHIWAWSLCGAAMPPGALAALQQSEAVYVSPISFYEIGQKVRLGKWPEMEPYIASLPDILAQQGALTAILTPEICLKATLLDWDHRDPFDRLLAATCLVNTIALVSVDAAFDGCTDNGRTITRLF